MRSAVHFFISFLVSLAPSLAFGRTAYLAVVGPGNGQGMLGHVFLVIAENEGQFLNAQAFQYSIRIPENAGALELATGLGSYPFVLEQTSAWTFIKSYSREQRSVSLYELKLDAEQIDKMEKSLLSDLASRRNQPQFDYDTKSNNCATKIYDQINAVVPSEFKLNYIPPLQGFYKLQFFRAKDISLVVPLSAAPVLKSHPLVRSETVFRLKNLVEIEIGMTAINKLSPLFALCGTDTRVKTILIRMYGNQQLREGEKYLPFFKGIFMKCAETHPELVESYNEHIDFVRMASENKRFLEWAMQFYIPQIHQ